MKCTLFESNRFKSTKKHVVFQLNQHSGKIALKSSRYFTREFKFKAIHYYYDNGENVKHTSSR